MQLCTGTPSTWTVHAPQSPESQPFFTPVQPASRRNVRRHCPGRGVLVTGSPLTLTLAVLAAKLGSHLERGPTRHRPPPGGTAVDVVQVAGSPGDGVVERLGEHVRVREAGEADLHGTRDGGGEGDGGRAGGGAGADEEYRRPAGRGQ